MSDSTEQASLCRGSSRLGLLKTFRNSNILAATSSHRINRVVALEKLNQPAADNRYKQGGTRRYISPKGDM
jgi:hypothetical protein